MANSLKSHGRPLVLVFSKNLSCLAMVFPMGPLFVEFRVKTLFLEVAEIFCIQTTESSILLESGVCSIIPINNPLGIIF